MRVHACAARSKSKRSDSAMLGKAELYDVEQ